MIGLNPRRAFLEGRRPRRLVGIPDICHVEAFVPSAGEVAGLPIAPEVIRGFVRTRDDRSWRAGGLAGLPLALNDKGGGTGLAGRALRDNAERREEKMDLSGVEPLTSTLPV